MTDWYLGTMGFSYKEWLGPFYPAGTQSRQYLPYYAGRFDAVEMDTTFYAIPAAETVRRWAQVTPPGFKMAPKMVRDVTHEQRLRGVASILDPYLDTMRLLGDKLGPIVLQFPPDFSAAEIETFAAFLDMLPRDLRFAAEFRDKSWAESEETLPLLRAHRVALVAADYHYMPKTVERTADFLYLRLLGTHGRFPAKDRIQVDRSGDLELWWQQIRPHVETEDPVDSVYAFINDDFAGFAPVSVNNFKRIIGMEPGDIQPVQQGRLL